MPPHSHKVTLQEELHNEVVASFKKKLSHEENSEDEDLDQNYIEDLNADDRRQIISMNDDLDAEYADIAKIVTDDKLPEIPAEAEIVLEKVSNDKLSAMKAFLSNTATIEAEDSTEDDDAEELPDGVDEKVVTLYQKVGVILSRYRSGKLPKAFKIIPTCKNKMQLVQFTNPTSWTSNAALAACRIWVGQLTDPELRPFYEYVILPKIIDDIKTNGKLNAHLYECLKVTLYKPISWFTGFMLPLVNNEQCTLKMAQIVASCLKRNSVTRDLASAALIRLCQAPFSSSVTVFVYTILDKKYSLPEQAYNAVLDWFMQFDDDTEIDLNLNWQQSLLVLVHRYHTQMTPEERRIVLNLANKRCNQGIAGDIRRVFNKKDVGSVAVFHDEELDL